MADSASNGVVLGRFIPRGLRRSRRHETHRPTERYDRRGIPQLRNGGGFGTIQELVLYRTLAASFDHSDVLLFVLPANDFADPQYSPPSRYRPYLRRAGNRYDVYYTVLFDQRDQDVLTPSTVLWNRLSNHLAAVNLARQAIEARLHKEQAPTSTSYLAHSADEIDLMGEAIP
jgi:hypothetical protein